MNQLFLDLSKLRAHFISHPELSFHACLDKIPAPRRIPLLVALNEAEPKTASIILSDDRGRILQLLAAALAETRNV